MKREDIKKSFDAVKTSEIQKEIMLEGIEELNKLSIPVTKPILRHPAFVTAVCCLALTITISAWFIAFGNSFIFQGKQGEIDEVRTESGYDSPRDTNTASDSSEVVGDSFEGTTNDMAIAPANSQLGFSGRQYFKVEEQRAKELGIDLGALADNLGDKIAEIEKAADSKLIGTAVYKHKKIMGESLVVAKIDGEYTLFEFFMFDSYGDNRDENAVEYLKLYGINSAADIKKIEFIRYTDEAKLEERLNVFASINDKDEINSFYNFYRVIKDSSAEYFEKLFGSRDNSVDTDMGGVMPQTAPETIEPTAPDATPSSNAVWEEHAQSSDAIAYDLPMDTGGGREPYYYDTNGSTSSGSPTDRPVEGQTTTGSSSGSPGITTTNLLNNQVTIRIYAKDDIYFDAVYYPDMGFISRHKVSEDFAAFLAKYIG